MDPLKPTQGWFRVWVRVSEECYRIKFGGRRKVDQEVS